MKDYNTQGKKLCKKKGNFATKKSNVTDRLGSCYSFILFCSQFTTYSSLG